VVRPPQPDGSADLIFLMRELKSKIANRQYLLMILLEDLAGTYSLLHTGI
jgi:hypothetical protein